MKPVALTQKVQELAVHPRYRSSLVLLTRSKRGMSVKHLQEAIIPLRPHVCCAAFDAANILLNQVSFEAFTIYPAVLPAHH